MKQPWHICVLIPARNEEVLLPNCLKSVLAACSRLPSGVTCDIVVAVDASTDGTAEIAAHLLRNCGSTVITFDGKVGAARAAAAARALERYQGPLSCCWFAHTDADCTVPEDWLLRQLLLAEEGYEAVAGTITVDSFHEHAPHVEERFWQTYLVALNGEHSHVHGANMGVRADLYMHLEGWAKVATAEDHELWNRIQATNRKRISTSRVSVVTSGRRVGRAPLGFAGALNAHNEAIA